MPKNGTGGVRGGTERGRTPWDGGHGGTVVRGEGRVVSRLLRGVGRCSAGEPGPQREARGWGVLPAPKCNLLAGGDTNKCVREGVLQAASKSVGFGSPGVTAQHGTAQVTPKSPNFTQPLSQEPPSTPHHAAPKAFTPRGGCLNSGGSGEAARHQQGQGWILTPPALPKDTPRLGTPPWGHPHPIRPYSRQAGGGTTIITIK